MALAHPVGERDERRPQPRVVGIAERHQRAAAPLDVERGVAAEQDDVRAGDPGRARARSPRPRQRRAVRLRRVGRGEDERVVLGSTPQLAQPLDGAGQRELRTAETLDEVAAPAGADRLEGAQLAVDGAVAARDALAADAVAHDDALPLEQELRERTPVDGRRGTGAR